MAGREGIILQLPGEIAEAIKSVLEIVARTTAAEKELDHMEHDASNHEADQQSQRVIRHRANDWCLPSERDSALRRHIKNGGARDPRPALGESSDFQREPKRRPRQALAEIMRRAAIDREAQQSCNYETETEPQHHGRFAPEVSRAIARQPMSRRQKPSGHSMRSMAS